MEGDFAALYAPIGRPSIAPEKLLRAMLLQAFYSIRSERQLMERLEYDLLFRWFVGIGIDDAAWDHSIFSKNRDRLLEGDIAAKFLAAVLAQPRVKKLLSTDHFSVDGTLIEAWASMKSFRPKDGSDEPPAGGGRNAEANFHGQKRSNETHASTTDPDARLYRKGPGKEAKLCFIGHGLMENRSGLLVDACLTRADGHAERVAALHMIEPHADRPQAITLGADKAYDAEDFVNELRSMRVTPHVAQNTSGRQLGDRRAHDAAWRLRRQPAHPQAHRGGLRLDQDGGRPGEDEVPWRRSGRLRLHLRRRGLQSRAIAQAAGGAGMSAPAGCQLIGRWRIVEVDLWDRDFLDLVEPATITFGADNDGEIAFGALQGGIDLSYSPSIVFFTWAGFDEMDDVSGAGSRRMLDDGSLEIKFAYHIGDDAVLKAQRHTSSTAC